MKNKLLLSSFLLISYFSHGQINLFQKQFPSIDRYIDSLMKDWNIPGLAIGIVYKDSLIYGKGFGYRDLEDKLPVNTRTQFHIGSNTKLFTAIAACMLADEGKLSLDKPVRNYLPSLVFSNDELNAKVTLRDILSHRTGLAGDDPIWAGAKVTPREIAAKVVYLKPTLGFREGVIYNNVVYSSAGAVIEQVAGVSWKDFIQARIFHPLQMNRSWFSNEDMEKSGNFAYGYAVNDITGKLQRVNYKTLIVANPGGGITSNVEDMSHWMIALLNGGKFKGVQVIRESAIRQTLVPNIVYEKEAKWDELSHPLYGLGRFMQTYKGYKIAMHTGGTPDGYYANLTLVPSENLAVYMVFNGGSSGDIRRIMALPVIDRLLNLSYTPWSARYMKEHEQAKAADDKRKDSIKATQVKNTLPSHALKDYTGKYTSPAYGDLNIELESGSLVFTFRDVKSILNHFHFDQFVTKEQLPGRPNRLHFLTNAKGEIDRFVTLRDAEFVKVKSKGND